MTLFREPIWLVALACLAVCHTSHGQGTIQAITLTGDPSPDGKGNFAPYISGLSVTPAFDPPVINQNGCLAFQAQIEREGSAFRDRGILICTGGDLRLVMRRGETTPLEEDTVYQGFEDGSGTLAVDVKAPAINAFGTLVMTAQISGRLGISFDAALFKFDGLEVSTIFSKDRPVSGGLTTFDSWGNSVLNEAGQSALAVRNEVNANTFFPSIERVEPDNTMSRLVRGEELISELGITLTGVTSPAINAHGHVAFAAVWKIEEEFKRGILLVDDEGIHILAAQGDPAPDGDGVLGDSFDRPVLNNQGQVAFNVDIDEASSPQFALMLADKDSIIQIARRGKRTPNGITNFESVRPPSLNNSGVVVFGATATGLPNASGLYVYDGTSLTLMLADGSTAPDGDGAYRFNNQTAIGRIFALNDQGQIAFLALYRTSNNVNTKRVMFRDVDGTLYQIAREGQELEGSVITDLYLFGDHSSGRERDFGGRSPLNEGGQVAFWAELEDGRDGIFLWNPPSSEPRILTFAMDGDEFVFTIQSSLGFTYQLQRSTNPRSIAWSDEGSPVEGNGSILEFRQGISGLFSELFRVRIDSSD